VKNFKANSVFQGKRKLLKNILNRKYSEFRAHSVFRASASCSKILNVKRKFNTVKIFRATLFFRASASCSKILNDKNIYIQYSAFRAKSVFKGKHKLLKNPVW